MEKTNKGKKIDSLQKYESTFLEQLESTKFSINAFKETSNFKVTSKMKLAESSALLGSLKTFKKNLDNLYNDFYKPLRDLTQEMLYKPIKEQRDILEKIETDHKEQQIKWSNKKREEAKIEEERLEKELQKGNIGLEQVGKKLERKEEKVEAVKGITTVRIPKVVEFAKVPDEYKLINMPLVKEKGKDIEISGIQWVEEQRISNRY